MAKVYTYDPKNVLINVGGVYLTGFSEDKLVEVEQNEEIMIGKAGVDGTVHVAKGANFTATAKVTLMSTSPQLGYLRGIAKDQAIFEFSVVDMNEAGENITCGEAWMPKIPPYSSGKEVEEVEIEIYLSEWK